jgi:hypothetical protein
MKTIFKKLAALCAVLVLGGPGVAMLHAQQGGPPQVGFIRIVNAISPGEGKANFFLDGDDLFPKGYELGQRTGGLGIKAGAHTIEVRKEGVEPGSTRITLETGETLTLIAFAERLPVEKEGDPPRWTTKILRLKQSDPEAGYRMTVLSVCTKPEVLIQAAVQGKGAIETSVVKRLAISRVDLGEARGEVLVRADDDVITTISPDSPGNYVVILYEDAEGVVRALSFYDPKFVIAG